MMMVGLIRAHVHLSLLVINDCVIYLCYLFIISINSHRLSTV